MAMLNWVRVARLKAEAEKIRAAQQAFDDPDLRRDGDREPDSDLESPASDDRTSVNSPDASADILVTCGRV